MRFDLNKLSDRHRSLQRAHDSVETKCAQIETEQFSLRGEAKRENEKLEEISKEINGIREQVEEIHQKLLHKEFHVRLLKAVRYKLHSFHCFK